MGDAKFSSHERAMGPYAFSGVKRDRGQRRSDCAGFHAMLSDPGVSRSVDNEEPLKRGSIAVVF